MPVKPTVLSISPRKRIAGARRAPWGNAAGFSFYPGKNLGACGEGGAVTTNDEAIARTVRMIRDHGQSKKYYHDIEGYNGRLDSIQAGMLRVKLKHLPRWNKERRECAERYGELAGSHVREYHTSLPTVMVEARVPPVRGPYTATR